MSNEAANALAALGIASEPVLATATVATGEPAVLEAKAATQELPLGGGEAKNETTAPAPAAANDEPAFKAGDVEEVSFDELPILKRAFAGGGRTIYGIEDIAAPGTDGKKYHAKLVKFEGGDETAFKRSVQSSATGQNSKAKAADAPNYYITRSHEVGGKFVGIYVIRTDERPADETAKAGE
ncbi:hypothetical protein [Rhizobium phage RHEph15]|uniref:Uncharacterized protein n=1 Tax=Rhizobium phage RHph_TM34 TaxID=2509556 RepID=A0A7S5USG1_9CAUD|nr:hypothetical protein EVB35_011 [Rhizobium phage RHph_TM34]QXV74272.1 hypothetical protein [Rhizobium phage RHEph15]QXV74966.1 hypothetical protein [Rhizobium phage RHEph27]